MQLVKVFMMMAGLTALLMLFGQYLGGQGGAPRMPGLEAKWPQARTPAGTRPATRARTHARACQPGPLDPARHASHTHARSRPHHPLLHKAANVGWRLS